MAFASLRARHVACVVAIAALASCDHAAPFSPATPGDVGPFSQALPRRLTFYDLASRTPSVSGGTLLFARQSMAEPDSQYTPYGREECIAFMPVQGGTIARSLCPDRLITPADTFVDTWFEPVLSPDSSRIAFMWQRGTRVSALGFRDAYLMVTPLDHPTDTTGVRYAVDFSRVVGPNVIYANVATRIMWRDAGHLLFLATNERIHKVKGGGAERVTDTLWEPMALEQLDLTTGLATLVPGGDSVIAATLLPDGTLWVVKDADQAAVQRLDPASGQLTLVARFGAAIRDLVGVGGNPVAVTGDSTKVERIDLGTMASDSLVGFTGPVHRLAPAGGRQLVVEVEQYGKLFGAPPALWLYEWP